MYFYLIISNVYTESIVYVAQTELSIYIACRVNRAMNQLTWRFRSKPTNTKTSLRTTNNFWVAIAINLTSRNKCINSKKKTDQIDMKTLTHIIKKYKDEISIDATDKALLSPDNIGLFIKYKFPIARLENLSEDKDLPKKMYIMASILLFYCCVNSQSGKVDADICAHLDAEEQEMILKFCEVLNECEVTINNIDNAIEEACSTSKSIKKMLRTRRKAKNRDPPKVIIENNSNDSISSKTNSPVIEEKKKVTIQENVESNTKESQGKKFQSSITVLPSVVTDTSSYSKSSAEHFSDVSDFNEVNQKKKLVEEDDVIVASNSKHMAVDRVEVTHCSQEDSGDKKPRCQPECACTRCSVTGPCCGDPGSSMDQCEQKPKKRVKLKDFQDFPCKRRTYLSNWKLYLMLFIGILLAILLITTIFMVPKNPEEEIVKSRRSAETVTFYPKWVWQCKNNLCQKTLQPSSNTDYYNSLSRCTLLCMGPQLWPYPIGHIYFSKAIVALASNKLEYKFQAASDAVHQYVAEAFNIFIKDLIALEKVHRKPKNLTDLKLMKMSIQIEVDGDTDPRLRINTDETYNLKIESKSNQLLIKISAGSFCGARHGLETLSQLILLDEMSRYLITVSNAAIKDGPSYKYRGLMIDTGRNFIPVPDLLRTIDGMAKCKLNTFHWRISDVTSFPLQLSNFPELSEFGAYDRSLVYTREDIKTVVDWAGGRCIRVLIEVAMPGPIGRPWSWSPQASCPSKSDNSSCDNMLCLRLEMKDSLFDTLQTIYSEIVDLTKVDDIFHLSDGVFSMSNCFNLLKDREGFLDKALERLKIANGGFLPKLPIIWYTAHLNRDFEAKTWERFGVQINDWSSEMSIDFLSKFKVIYSLKWDLSCQMTKKRCTKYRTWQEMYSWKTWRNVEVFTVEGGETVLWTDLVDSGNLDYHLWPRTAAVAERLWSDVVANASATRSVYIRLDHHRWRMLLHGVEVQPIWSTWCSYNAGVCLDKIHQ